MKKTGKWMSLFLVLVMFLSSGGDFAVRAEETITVVLRVERSDSTELAPVSVTLTDADKKDFGIGLGTETLTPLHALAKYLQKEKNVADGDMGKYIIASSSAYGLYVTGISMKGDGVGSAATGETENVFWNYRVNDAYVDVGMDSYALKSGDSIVFYGMWSPYPAEDEVLYASFDKASYSAVESEKITVTLTGSGVRYDENSNAVPYTKPVKGATVTAMMKEGIPADAPIQSIYWTAETDAEGRAEFTLFRAGTYEFSAYRYAADGKHYDISRPYAEVTVTGKTSAVSTPTVSPSAQPSASPSTPSVTPSTSPSASPASDKWKVSAPSGLKVTVKKSKAAKKKITVTWKKAKCHGNVSGKVSGYEVVLSKKKKNGYKKIARTGKTKVSLKKGKGKYYVKVRAYKMDAGRFYFSGYTAPVVVRVK